MDSVLIASKNAAEVQEIADRIGKEFDVLTITSPEGIDEKTKRSQAVLVDFSYVEDHGTDSLSPIIKSAIQPVLMLTPPNDIMPIIEAIRVGVWDYIIKIPDYQKLLSFQIRAALDKFQEQRRFRETITTLETRLSELEARISQKDKDDSESPTVVTDPSKVKESLLDEIIYVYRRGEISLPIPSQLSGKFQEMLKRGDTLQDIGNLLKQDAAISSKLISVSNSAYYRGVAKSATVGQAINRLGLDNTKRYVDVITNRALYKTERRKFEEFLEKLWEHSLACAYASQFIAETLKLKLTEDAFTLGLLHDIGRLLLFQTIDELQEKKKIGENIEYSEIIGTIKSYHGRFGAALLKKWKFSNIFIKIGADHDRMSFADQTPKEMLVVHLGNCLVKSIGYNNGDPTEIDLENLDSTRLLQIDFATVEEIKERVQAMMDEIKGYFN